MGLCARLVGLVGLVATGLAGTIGTAQASHVVCPAVITSNTTLDADLKPCVGGIVIAADNVTLDLNGHTVEGVPDRGEGPGILLQNVNNVVVKNGTVRLFDAGIEIAGGSNNEITGVTAEDNLGLIAAVLISGGDGIEIHDSANNYVHHNNVLRNGPLAGIAAFVDSGDAPTTGNRIENNFIDDNNIPVSATNSQDDGIRMEPGVTNTVVKNNTVTDSGLDGIAVFAASTGNVVENNTVSNNGNHTATHRKGDGIRAFATGNNNTIKSNTVTGNAANGIIISGQNNTIHDNTSTGNSTVTTLGTFDLLDTNANCDNNNWLDNTFGTASPTCTTAQSPDSADLSVTKTDSPDPATLGENLTYSLTVTNNGPDLASGVSLSDTLPASVSFVSATASQGSCSQASGTVSCALGSLANGASATVDIVVEPNSTGTISNTASVSGDQADSNAANNSATATTTVNNTHGCTIVGTGGADVLSGTAGNDVICGLGGNDTLSGLGGDDTLRGGSGDDTAKGDNGIDSVIGGSGADSLEGNNGNDSLNSVDGVSGNDSLNGGMGSDSCSADSGDLQLSCP